MVSQNEKQEFIGGLVAAALAKKGVEVIVGKALDKVASAKNTKMAKADVAPATEVVMKDIRDEAVARIEHRTDAEDHWRSRNVWGSIMVMIGAVDIIYKLWTDGMPNTIEDYWAPASVIIGGLVPMYSRFIAKKPLFR